MFFARGLSLQGTCVLPCRLHLSLNEQVITDDCYHQRRKRKEEEEEEEEKKKKKNKAKEKEEVRKEEEEKEEQETFAMFPSSYEPRLGFTTKSCTIPILAPLALRQKWKGMCSHKV